MLYCKKNERGADLRAKYYLKQMSSLFGLLSSCFLLRLLFGTTFHRVPMVDGLMIGRFDFARIDHGGDTSHDGSPR